MNEIYNIFFEAVKEHVLKEKKHNATFFNNLGKKAGLSVTEVRTLVECSLVKIYAKEKKFEDVVKIYKAQPNISQRTSTVVLYQQYSTPAPICFLAGEFVGAGNILDPTAGTGMFSINLKKGSEFYANELEKTRLKFLNEFMGFKNISPLDATKDIKNIFKGVEFDGLLVNPPFGKHRGEVDGYKIINLEHFITLNALTRMKDNGRAFIVIGGHTERNERGLISTKDRFFYNYLSTNYNIIDVINTNGDLYSKQGTSFDIRIILICGRKAAEKYTPYKFSESIVSSFDALKKRIDAAKAKADLLITDEGLGSPYIPVSRGKTLEVSIPDNMELGTLNALRIISKKYGQIDDYVSLKLQWTKAQLFERLSAEQIDAMALIIYNSEDLGMGMIIGDQTGIGKGRVAAATLLYAIRNGQVPIFLTEKSNLFSDIYRDLKDIGGAHYKPLIFNTDAKANIINENNEILYHTEKDFASTVKGMPSIDARTLKKYGYSLVLCTYSQLSGGGLLSMNLKKSVFSSLCENNYVVLDESHNASGETSNTGIFLEKELQKNSVGCLFLSATFAKRPKNMGVYAAKTSIKESKLNSETLAKYVSLGGVALQEWLSYQLAKEGQMIRRERSYSYATVNYNTVKDDSILERFDKVVEIVQLIIEFQNKFVALALKRYSEERGGATDYYKTDKDLGAKLNPVFSRLFLLVNQLLLNLKVDYVAKLTETRLKEGYAVIIALSNTMESTFSKADFIDNDGVAQNSFSVVLFEALRSSQNYTLVNEKGTTVKSIMSLEQMDVLLDYDSKHRDFYSLIRQKIKNISGIYLSPIDTLRTLLARHKVVELTGRSARLNVDHSLRSGKIETVAKPLVQKEFNRFNNNETEVLIINQVAATGASAHAAPNSKVSPKDVKKRCMIILQSELDISKEIQKRGRIYRTGQVYYPTYDYVTTEIPAEHRLMMMLKNKLASLDANTSSNQEQNKDLLDHPDFLNKYGDKIVKEWLDNNPKDAKILGFTDNEEVSAATRYTGRVAVLSTARQRVFYNEVAAAYIDYVDYLKSAGQYDLEMTRKDLRAETLSKKMISKGDNNATVFGQDTYLEICEVNNLRKPLTKKDLDAEVKKAEQKESSSTFSEKIFGLLSQAKAALAESTDVNDKNDDDEDKVSTKTAERAIKSHERALSILKYFSVGDTRLSRGTDFTDEVAYVFLGYSVSVPKGWSGRTSITAKFAVSDFRRVVSLNLSILDTWDLFNQITQLSEIESGYSDIWDKVCAKTSLNRVKAAILTGNLLRAFSYNERGELCTFTTKDGEERQGLYLLNRDVEKLTGGERSPRAQENIYGLDLNDFLRLYNSGDTNDIESYYLFPKESKDTASPYLSIRHGTFYIAMTSRQHALFLKKHKDAYELKKSGNRYVGTVGELDTEQSNSFLKALFDVFGHVLVSERIFKKYSTKSKTSGAEAPYDYEINTDVLNKFKLELAKEREQDAAELLAVSSRPLEQDEESQAPLVELDDNEPLDVSPPIPEHNEDEKDSLDVSPHTHEHNGGEKPRSEKAKHNNKEKAIDSKSKKNNNVKKSSEKSTVVKTSVVANGKSELFHYTEDLKILRRFSSLYSPKRKKAASKHEARLFLAFLQKKIISKELRRTDKYADLVASVQKFLLTQIKGKGNAVSPKALREKVVAILNTLKIAPFVTASRSFITNEDEDAFNRKLKAIPYTPFIKSVAPKLKNKAALSLSGVLGADDLKNTRFKVFDFKRYDTVFGEVSLPVMAMISGLPGSGKTTFFMQIGGFLSLEGLKVLFVSNEEGIGHTLQNKLNRIEYDPKKMFVSYEIPSNWSEFDVIVLDSVNTIGITVKEFDEMKKIAKANGVSILGIFKATKTGNYKGESDFEHDVDISLSAENGVIKVKKNRFGGNGSYSVF